MAHSDFIVFRATCEATAHPDIFGISASLTIKRPFTKTLELTFKDEYYTVLGCEDFKASGLPTLFERVDRHSAKGLLKDLSKFVAEFSAWSTHHSMDSVGFEEYPHAMRKGPFVVGASIREGFRFLLARDL